MQRVYAETQYTQVKVHFHYAEACTTK